MRNQTKHPRQRPNIYTQEEKRNLYLQWERSGQSKAKFCQSRGITKSAFYSWCHRYKPQDASSAPDFSPITLKACSSSNTENMVHLEICLANQTKILIPLQKSDVVSFIQELSHATSAIR